MIKNIRLLHHLSENTYNEICIKLGLARSDQRKKNNFAVFPKDPIYRISLFDLVYKTFGHIWFMNTSVSFPDFSCSSESFKDELFAKYSEVFGEKAMADFPSFENICCDHIEYCNIYKVENSAAVVEQAQLQGCPTVLNELKDDDFVGKPHGKIEFCVSRKDDTHIETLARCHGAALKQRIKDKSFHAAAGISAAKMSEEQTENDIMSWLLKRYKISVLPEQDKFDNRVNVIGEDGKAQNPTYLRRAKGLVKNSRAQWMDEKTIKMVDSPDTVNESEAIDKKHKYHCQHQAEAFADAIIPFSKDYPLQAGLPEDFPLSFSKLCEFAKGIYLDMAERPDSYGLKLVDIESTDHNLAREGYRSIHRFCDTLANLSRCGELENHKLSVNTSEFRQASKKLRVGVGSGAEIRIDFVPSGGLRFCNFRLSRKTL